MTLRLLTISSAMFAIAVLSGCDDLPGRPKPGPEVPRPDQVLSFQTLYQESCAGCHGADGQKGSATNLANPEYQALIDDATLRDVITKGQKGTLMPGFGKIAGGDLTDEQIDVLVKGIRAQWSKGDVLQGQNAPPYKTDKTGDPTRGQQLYAANCAQCHGDAGGPPGPKGSILDGSFLALVSEQTIRTTAIVGRPDLGMPNWRDRVPGHPMTDQDVTDTVAWIMSQRQQTPGQPYAQQPEASSNSSKQGGS
jgi:cytochrome c oxidase cbb3-type subunit III